MTDDEAPSSWAEIVGPYYTVASMARALGWTEAEVIDAGNDLRLLMVRTSDDVDLFPSFQLQGGKIVDGLQDVLRILATGTAGRWTWAQWLSVVLPDAESHRNITLLYEGHVEEVLQRARQDAWAWSS